MRPLFPREREALDLVSRGMATACPLHTLRRLEEFGFVVVTILTRDRSHRATSFDAKLTDAGHVEAARGRIASRRTA